MHACEALIAAFEATGDRAYLLRAETLAHNITVRQAALADNMVWEHYHADWSVDGIQPPRQEQYLPPMGLPAGPPDRMGQAVAAAGAPRAPGQQA
jgi:mannose/cellobiose epimerase-like protein (N-acyl-D-glucosamine 2-epimerase family)